MHFCKKLLGIKQKHTKNDFMYGELGSVNFAANRYISFVLYWLKIVTLTENICKMYMLLGEIWQNPNNTNWASSVRDLFLTYGYFSVWLS